MASISHFDLGAPFPRNKSVGGWCKSAASFEMRDGGEVWARMPQMPPPSFVSSDVVVMAGRNERWRVGLGSKGPQPVILSDGVVMVGAKYPRGSKQEISVSKPLILSDGGMQTPLVCSKREVKGRIG